MRTVAASRGAARQRRITDRSIVDRSVSPSQPGVLGQSPLGREMQIACDSQVPWPAYAFQDGQAHMAELRHAHAEVEQAEGGVAISGIEFGQQPGRVRVQGEQLDDRQRVALLAARGSSTVIQQLDALGVGDERFHGRCPETATISAASVLRKRADAPKRDCTSALLHQIAKADSTESVEGRTDEYVNTEAMISVKAVFSIDTPDASLSREDYK